MEMLQQLLVYATVALAFGYLLRKFVLPKRLVTKKAHSKACGQEDCGCQ